MAIAVRLSATVQAAPAQPVAAKAAGTPALFEACLTALGADPATETATALPAQPAQPAPATASGSPTPDLRPGLIKPAPGTGLLAAAATSPAPTGKAVVKASPTTAAGDQVDSTQSTAVPPAPPTVPPAAAAPIPVPPPPLAAAALALRHGAASPTITTSTSAVGTAAPGTAEPDPNDTTPAAPATTATAAPIVQGAAATMPGMPGAAPPAGIAAAVATTGAGDIGAPTAATSRRATLGATGKTAPIDDAADVADADALPSATTGVAHQATPDAATAPLPSGPASTDPAAAKPADPAQRQVAEQAGGQVAVSLARALANGDRTMTVQLHPGELGRVDLRLTFHQSGVSVQMTLESRQTFDAFTQNRGSLEQQLAQTGVDLGGNGLDLRFQQNDQSGQQPGQQAASGFAVVAEPANDAVAPSPQRLRGSAGLDIIA